MESENELENLLTTLLLPVAGKKVYSEEDTSRMPLVLGSTLLIEREPVDDPEILIEALEAIYLIALQATGGGAYRFADLFKEKLGVSIDKEDEMNCLVAGANFLLKGLG